jgi:alpha-L-fucosidase 2
MVVLFRQSTFPNLMDTHPPGLFQIDGNLGGANGMLEALLQSRWYADHCEVDFLPALPKEWDHGSVSGIRVRGGAELDLAWDGGKVRTSHWRVSRDGVFELRVPSGQHLRRWTANGRTQSLPTEKAGVIGLTLRKGAAYELSFD